MGTPRDRLPQQAKLLAARFRVSRLIAVIAVVIALRLSTSLQKHLHSGIHGAYKLLHIHGTFAVGPRDSSETVFLVGDAGAMSDAVALALEKSIRSTKPSPALVYLGDNVYPLGIPKDRDSAEWRLATSLLLRQINPFRSFTRGIFFIPGNHDWENHSVDGWNAIKRESAFIDTTLGPDHIAPSNGCPGPSRILLFPDLQAITIDSNWWLHEHAKPTRFEDGCETFSEQGFLTALDSMLNDTPSGVETLVLLHHPLLSADSDSAHTTCPSSPDCPAYISMRKRIGEVLASHRPLLCASGHNHSLQVHKEQAGCRTYVVSGGGSTAYRVAQPQAALFSEASLGFVILHRDANDGWKLDVLRVRGDESLLPPGSSLAYSTIMK